MSAPFGDHGGGLGGPQRSGPLFADSVPGPGAPWQLPTAAFWLEALRSGGSHFLTGVGRLAHLLPRRCAYNVE